MGCFRQLLRSLSAPFGLLSRKKTSSIRSAGIGPPTNFRKETCMFQPFTDDDGYVMMIHSQNPSPIKKETATVEHNDHGSDLSDSIHEGSEAPTTSMDRLKKHARKLSVLTHERNHGQLLLLQEEHASADLLKTNTQSEDADVLRASVSCPTLRGETESCLKTTNGKQEWKFGV